MAVHMLIIVQVTATQSIANVVKSSFGPSGLDKMMVDDIGVEDQDLFLGPTLMTIRMLQSPMTALQYSVY